MSSHVVQHVALGSETQTAVLRTRKRSVIGVNEHVRLQILLLRKGLAAGQYWTHKGVRAIVTMHVRAVTIQTSKFFAAVIALENSIHTLILVARNEVFPTVYMNFSSHLQVQ